MDALERGTRALAAMQPLQMLHRFLSDPKVKRRTIAGTRMLDGARRIRITSDAGTDITVDKTGRPADAHYSCADEPGVFTFEVQE